MVLLAAAAIAFAQTGRVSVRMRVLRLDESAKISGKGFDVTHQPPANFGVGLDPAVNDIVDGLLKDHKAHMINDQSLTALMGEPMRCSFQKERDDERIDIMPSALGDGYRLDLNWHYDGRAGIINHRFSLPKGDGGIVVVRVGNSRLCLALNASPVASDN